LQAVKGPGVPIGGIDNTLSNIQDIVPTLMDLAGEWVVTNLGGKEPCICLG
jgi:arylsulfatase A-like enzyme